MKTKTLNVTQRWIFEIAARDGEHSVVHIPQELMEIILPNLPVKSLMRFRCVSKSWRSLIDSKTFIRKHLEISQRREVLYDYCSFIYDECCEWQVPKSINDDPLTSGSIVGCCNGVICILKKGCFFLWNPATKISLNLPTLELAAGLSCHEIRCGFGWDEETDAYKVFVYITDGYKSLGRVYSSKTKSWKEVVCRRLYDSGGHRLYNVGVLASGKLHWVPQRALWFWDSEKKFIRTCIIENFDLKSEVFGRIELPSEPVRGIGRWWLRERDGCLEALYYHKDDEKRDRRHKVWLNKGYDNLRRKERDRERRRGRRQRRRGEEEGEILDVWVMEEYGVKESWVKKSTITIPNPKFTLEYQQYVYVESLISPISEDDAERRN